MAVSVRGVIPQLRTTDLSSSIRFYTTQLGFTLDFQYEDFYAGVRAGGQSIHLKRVDEKDPSIAFVREGEHLHAYFEVTDVRATASTLKSNGVRFVRDLHDTQWGTTEFAIEDDQGHTLYFGAPR
jgi:catechol 2,3-dioxygenase-like lactoylglutathione lyase family enzyme